MRAILGVLVAFALGALPWGVWLSRWFAGVDVRTLGSGNPGATNVYRSLGPKLGIAVFALDVLKGVAGVLACRAIAGDAFPLGGKIIERGDRARGRKRRKRKTHSQSHDRDDFKHEKFLASACSLVKRRAESFPMKLALLIALAALAHADNVVSGRRPDAQSNAPKLADTHMVGTLPTLYLFTNEDD